MVHLRHSCRISAVLLAWASSMALTLWADELPVGTRINQLQLVGTHNSYHIAPDAFAMKLIAIAAESEAQSLDCSQRPLTEQLAVLGLRHLELDVYRDPEGKLFRTPAALIMAQRQNAAVAAFDPDQQLHTPGIKILHSPDFDFRTTSYTLRNALTEIRIWSGMNPRHVPVFVLLELKSDSFSPLTVPVAWNEAGFDELERTILETVPREQLLTPHDDRPCKRTAYFAFSMQNKCCSPRMIS